MKISINWEAVARPFLNWQTRLKVKRMRKLVEKHWSQTPKPDRSDVKPITATFVCPKPPDYEGLNAISWGVDQWETEFQRLNNLGIDTAILQAAVAEDTQGQWHIYYPISDTCRSNLQMAKQRIGTEPAIKPQVVPAILKAAKNTGIKVHLGLFSCIRGWYVKSSAQLVQQIQREQASVARDLLDLYGNHPALGGWYISPEIMYFLHGKKLKLDLHSFLKGITGVLKRETPETLVGISPGATVPKGDSKPVLDFWVNTLRDSGVDLLYPQDAVGQLVNYPPQLSDFWSFCNEIANKTGITLWANCENFERKSFHPTNPFHAASFDRLLWQNAAASPHVEKIVSWECMHFLNSNGAKGGKELEKGYRKFFN